MSKEIALLKEYQTLTRIDLLLDNIRPQYPFQLHEKAKYTQHQLTLYRDNYCFKEDKPQGKSTHVEGGASHIDIILI